MECCRSTTRCSSSSKVSDDVTCRLDRQGDAGMHWRSETDLADAHVNCRQTDLSSRHPSYKDASLLSTDGPIQQTYSTVFDPITLPESPEEYDYTWNVTVYITNDWGARAIYQLPATVGEHCSESQTLMHTRDVRKLLHFTVINFGDRHQLKDGIRLFHHFDAAYHATP